MIRFYNLLLSLAIISTNLQAQESTIRCTTDEAMDTYYQHHPKAIESARKLESFTKRFKQNASLQRAAAVYNEYVIPVVFHINDAENPYKVTYEQVQSAVDILNEDFSATNADFDQIDPDFSGIAANVGVKFQLARFDPDGNPTSGITYHYNSFTGREPDGTGKSIKNVSYWPGENYLNIWICHEVAERGVFNDSGWAFLPSDGILTDKLDGIVYNYRYLGKPGIGVSETASQPHIMRVITHEVGHFLNLHHTFKNECDGDGDSVDDTPATEQAAGCSPGSMSCGGVVNSENFMDYNPCYKMFTEGQKTRMLAALNSNIAKRNNLWDPENLKNTLGTGLSGGFADYSSAYIKESSENDGSLNGAVQINLNGTAFAINSGLLSADVHYTVQNLPEGLELQLEVTNSSTASLSFSGKAIAHDNSGDVSNLSITMLGAAFVDAISIANPVSPNLLLDFINPYEVVYADISNLTVTTTETWERFDLGAGNGSYGIFYNTDAKSFQLETYEKDAVTVGTTRNLSPLPGCFLVDGQADFTAGGDYPDLHDVHKDDYQEWRGKTQYVGIRFQIDGNQHYGWIRLLMSENGSSLTLLDYAYNETPEEGILTGQKESFDNAESTTVTSVTVESQVGEAIIDSGANTIEVNVASNSNLQSLSVLIQSSACTVFDEVVNLSSGSIDFNIADLQGNMQQWTLKVNSVITSIDQSGIEDEAVLFPNPSTGSVNFSLSEGLKIRSVQVFNTSGQEVLYEERSIRNGRIDLSQCGSGLFVVRFNTTIGVIYERLLIKHTN